MGRILSGGTNSSVVGGGALQNLSTTVVTGEPVVQGQLACIGSDGLAYYALDPAAPGGPLRPLAGTTAPSQPFATGPAVTLSGPSSQFSTGCTLSNGNAVMVTATGSALQFGIYSSLGVQQGSVVIVPHAAATISMYAVALSGGGFALAYQDLGTMLVTVAVFSNTGAQILAPLIVEAGVVPTSLAIAPLAGGGFAVAYGTSAGAVRYAVYSASGAIIQAPAATGLTGILTTSPCAVSICALTAGGFVVAGMVTNLVAAYFSRFSATGAAQQTAVSAYTGSSVSNTTGTLCAVGLTGGGFIIVQHYGGSSGTIVTTLSAAGVTVGSSYVGGSSTGTYFPACAAVARMDGSAVVVAQSYIFVANGNGTLGAQAGVNGGGGYGNAVAQSDNGWIISAGYGSTLEIRDSSLNLVSTLQSYALGLLSGQMNSPPICLLSVGRSPIRPSVPLVLILTPGSGGARFVSCALPGGSWQKTTPIGVFTASAAAGSSVPVQYQGVATLASGFAQPYVFDATSTSPPGQRMAIIGNQAILSGIQPLQSTRRQIN